ncbi:glycoside hydrolase family 1 protein [Mollicutes bacterium LVI A0078]|nr:glycoside hydrolase family 1 protein [Mollicutes bacterium LVI A0075]WOO90729.1 glycoside hydrolase family 1 protein [Mollicutes bacterium LVI A0078]
MIKFKDDFLWGAAASGPQTEGNTNKSNLNVWDLWFEREPNRFYNQLSSSIACDTYNRYEDDVRMMKDINLNSFRTSIQWARLIEDLETSAVSQDAVEFYNAYINELLDNDIEPIINLYHFDMPAELMTKYGGFESKYVVDLFVDYTKKCFELFGDRVKYFTIFNEPIVPVEGGYFYDFHYPNKIDSKLGIQVAYNSILAQAKAIAEFKKLDLSCEVGTTLNLTPAYPRSNHPADVKASEICDVIFNRSFVDPSVKGTFPKLLLEILSENELIPEYTSDELEIIKSNTVDFLGLNYYVPRRVCAPAKAPNTDGPWMPEWYFDNYSMPGSRNNPHRDNNEIYPVALYDIAKDVQENYSNIKWYLAEIGISITGEENMRDENGVVDDSFRTKLFKEHMIELHRAIEEGSNCFGVHQWTFIDNWSWLNSHKRRYGFYFLDLETRERYIKKHALWFKEMIKNNGF